MGYSCQKQETSTEFNWAYPLAGDWTVKVDDGSSQTDPFFMTIYNAANGNDSIWIEEAGYWTFKAKASVNMKDKTFQTTEYNSYPDSKSNDLVTIKNSKLVGNDSIYFEVEFGSDAGKIYKYAGHRKISYEEYNTH